VVESEGLFYFIRTRVVVATRQRLGTVSATFDLWDSRHIVFTEQSQFGGLITTFRSFATQSQIGSAPKLLLSKP
jgi:hypothetical protein